PKTLKKKVLDRNGGSAIQPRPEQSIAEINMRHGQQLPVFDTFQKFIANERRNTRNQVATLSLFFTGVVILIIAGALFVGMTFHDQLRDDVRAMKMDKSIADTARSRNNAAIIALAHDTNRLKEHANKNNRDLATAKELSTFIGNRMNKIGEVIKMLELENSSLRDDLAKVKNNQPDITEYVRKVIADIENQRQSIITQTHETAPVVTHAVEQSSLQGARLASVAEEVSEQVASAWIVSTIVSRDTESATEWLFSIPE
ncbi:MAG: hypothetical protein KAH23_07385, partial [Kiritimatiellae bacterium]|nr:hypothetical protein [Kiritimatiellia bacterium]